MADKRKRTPLTSETIWEIRRRLARGVLFDPLLQVRYPDVNVQSKDQQAAGDHLQFVDQQLITVPVVDLLLGPF